MNNLNSTSLVNQIDQLLPQTQCGQCGYKGCKPYAEAIVRGETEINRCPPGGQQGVGRLASLLGVSVLPLNVPFDSEYMPQQAIIDEAHCIGCTRCLSPCPVDAIIGANKQLHTVLVEECTGCGLCLKDCPVDCIVLVPATIAFDPAQSRKRYQAKSVRLAIQEQAKVERMEKQKQLLAKIKSAKTADT